MRFLITLQSEQLILVSPEPTTSNYRTSGSVIPGRTWRGAYAEALRREQGDLFARLFPDQVTGQEIRFGPLFPASFESDVHPLPPTAFSCKYQPGFPQRGSSAHGVYDTLIRQFAFAIASQEGRTAPAIIDELRCPACGAAGEPYTGFWDQPSLSATTHVAINRVRHVAEDGFLYMREGLEAGQYYTGWVELPGATSVKEALELFPSGMSVYVGANRSRGMGRMRIVGLVAHDVDTNLEERIARFNRKLLDELTFYADQSDEVYDEIDQARQNRFFTIDLRSEAILYRDGLPTDEISELARLPASCVRAWLEQVVVGGWHAAAGLPRRTQAGVVGTYLCRFEGEPNLAELRGLSTEGIGELREQGYGQLMICNPVHYDDWSHYE